MGYRYIKHTFEDGQVIEATKIVENMKVFAHEINGNLDRENLPLDALQDSRRQCEDECFNSVSQDMTSLTNLKGLPAQFFSILSKTIDVPVDSLIIAHFGCWYEWHINALGTNVNHKAEEMSTGLSASWHDHALDLGASASGGFATTYDNIGEIFIDFRLRINGEIVCSAPRFSFIRRINSVNMNGVLPVIAGKTEILVEARQYRLVSSGSGHKDILVNQDAFYVNFAPGAGHLITQVKKR
tara:strand:- start:421 stop:1143 length:723 start_codon:yes stop_codon:yes gene_type:complete